MKFTTENAAENARKATIARVANELREAEAAEAARVRLTEPPRDATEDLRKTRLIKQIEILDRDIEDNYTSAELRAKLLACKARVWELLYPKPGSLRPRQDTGKRKPEAQGDPETP